MKIYQKLRNGLIRPIATNAPIKFKIAKNKIIKPAVLKKIFDFNVSANFADAKLINANIGKVPSVKNNIVKAPLIKLPVDKE